MHQSHSGRLHRSCKPEDSFSRQFESDLVLHLKNIKIYGIIYIQNKKEIKIRRNEYVISSREV